MTPTRERLEAQFEALAPADRDERTATLTWYTGASVRRYDARGPFEMRFSMEPGAIRMGHLASGSAPLLNSHRDFTVGDVIGVIARAWVENGQGKATVRFSKRAEVDPVWQDVQDGILRNASMGVAIHAVEDVTPQGTAMREVLVTDWEPEEVSLVPIGADPGAGFKFERATGPQEQKMDETIVTAAGEEARDELKVNLDAERQAAALAERARIREIEKVGRTLDVDARPDARTAQLIHLPLAEVEQIEPQLFLLIDAVKARLAAQGPTDAPAKPLTKRYAIWKTRKGKGNRRNLTFTGDLLRNFQVRTVSENRAKANLSTRKDRIKAWANEKREAWMVFSPKNKAAVVEAARKMLEAMEPRLLVEKALGGRQR
jgi:hypothetical protein